MDKVGIVTFHLAYNYGAALQTYALYTILKDKFNVDPVLVDYSPFAIWLADSLRFLPISLNFGEIVNGFRTIKSRNKKRILFDNFLKNNFIKTSSYKNTCLFKKDISMLSTCICGSDQIWNPHLTLGVSKPLYLDFLPSKITKASYAASFGLTNIPQKYESDISKLLESFDYISVRENSGIDIVKKLTGKEAICNIDPTLLLETNIWENCTKEILIDKPYILVYNVQNTSKTYKTAQILKDKFKLKIVEISPYGYKRDGIDLVLTEIGPSEFLGLFKNASYICTNSYHGLLFSLIYKKTCFTHSGKRWNERSQNILNIIDQANKSIVNQNIDINNVMEYGINLTDISLKNLEKEKIKSFNYLEKVLGN